MNHRFTIGVEEEFQIVDPATGELRSHVSELVAATSSGLGEQVKPEMHQSIVEIGTKICGDVDELAADMRRTRGELVRAAERVGLQVAAAGTHPLSSWIDQVISPGDRYKNIVEELQQLARALLIFALGVHVAVPHRPTIFRRFPRTGIPDHFSSWSEYEDYVNLLVRLHGIDNAKKIWWDVRPHPTFGTLEFRVFDVATRIDEAIAIAALTQAIVVKLHRLYTRNMGFRMYPRALIEENKWRAAPWGIEGNLIDFGKQAEVPMAVLIEELFEFVDDVLDELGSRAALEPIRAIFRHGTSAERQLRVHKETGDLQAVVRHIVAETREGVSMPAGSAAGAPQVS